MTETSNSISICHLAKASSLDGANISDINTIPVSWYSLPNGQRKVLSLYSDFIWQIEDSRFPSSAHDCEKFIRFKTIPPQFVEPAKYALLRYDIETTPAGLTLLKIFYHLRTFFVFLDSMNISSTRYITPLICTGYANHLKAVRTKRRGQPLTKEYLHGLLLAVELLYENLKITSYAFMHPWPESSAAVVAELDMQPGKKKSKTAAISDTELKKLFQYCYQLVERADELINLKVRLRAEREKLLRKGLSDRAVDIGIREFLGVNGFRGLKDFNKYYGEIPDAVAIIILIFSGIRAHELCAIQTFAYRKEIREEATYYWLKSNSTKTYEGYTEWLVPEIVIQAIDVQKKYSRPLREKLIKEERLLIHHAPDNPRAKQIQKFKNHLFLTTTLSRSNQINSLKSSALRNQIRVFGERLNIRALAPHRFRRTFALYVAKSIYGDLRYLKRHFKHWSIDMTLLYAFNDSQSEELYDEVAIQIRNHKVAIVEQFLSEDSIITGGLANRIISFRSSNERVRTYKTHSEMVEKVSELVHLRSTGHSWCTSEQSDCTGRSAIQATACIECSESIIEKERHGQYFMELYKHQLALRQIDDIGEAGKQRVNRDIRHCEKVLKELDMWDEVSRGEGD
jgi:integrase